VKVGRRRDVYVDRLQTAFKFTHCNKKAMDAKVNFSLVGTDTNYIFALVLMYNAGRDAQGNAKLNVLLGFLIHKTRQLSDATSALGISIEQE